MKKKQIVLLGIAAFFVFAIIQEIIKEHTFKLSGSLEMTEHSLGMPVSGRLATLLVTEGSAVHKDDVVATLDRYEQAKKDYDRLEALYRAGGADKQTLEHAYLAMTDQRIISPVDGTVLVKVHEVGEIVQAGSPVAVVGDDSDLWVRVYVPENYVSKVWLGQKAALHFDGFKKAVPGHVSYISPKAEFTPRNVQTPEERITQTFAIKIALDEKNEYLKPGIFADAKLDFKK